ncbi:MAG: hypothetical protein RAK22_02530 [Nanoarchaeota archaeon]|nr:hypothetical protein [Nanoarchaeota archaeon]
MGKLKYINMALFIASISILSFSIASATSYSLIPTDFVNAGNITNIYHAFPIIGKGVVAAYEYDLPNYDNFSLVYRLVNYANFSSASTAFSYMYNISNYTSFPDQTFGLSKVPGFHSYGLLLSPADNSASLLLFVNDSVAELDVFGNTSKASYYTVLSGFSNNFFALSIPPGQFGAPSQKSGLSQNSILYIGIILSVVIIVIFLVYLRYKGKSRPK